MDSTDLDILNKKDILMESNPDESKNNSVEMLKRKNSWIQWTSSLMIMGTYFLIILSIKCYFVIIKVIIFS